MKATTLSNLFGAAALLLALAAIGTAPFTLPAKLAFAAFLCLAAGVLVSPDEKEDEE